MPKPTLSTTFGLVPMIYETSLRAKVLMAMAINLGFGILIATPVRLLAAPAMAVILNDLSAPARRRLRPAKAKAARETAPTTPPHRHRVAKPG